ncbi:FUSC family protein [Paraburkholderia youngii]|uniref:FUSC family protein n=1 Tax=Paraburkholderia youngii TaxID=2782701 RepID=UPI003D1AD3E8
MSTLQVDQERDAPALALAWVPAWIRAELAPFPGRVEALWRFLLSTTLVVVISMALQVPFLPLSLIIVFFTAQENTVLTRLSGIVMVIGTTIAVISGLLLLKFTINYPLLRILAACAMAFCGMYFMRVSKLGAIGYLLALFVFYVQSFVDQAIGPEALVRALLWVWVAITYPIVLTITVNLLFLPSRPGRLLTDEMRRQVDHVLAQLEAHRIQTAARPHSAESVARSALVLHRHLAFAAQDDAAWRRNRAYHLARVAAIDRLHIAASHLSRLPLTALSPVQAEQVLALQSHCRGLRTSLVDGTPFTCDPNLAGTRPVAGPFDTVLREMGHALQAIGEAETLPAPSAQKREGLVAADAFSNAAYGRFALKTVLAATLCYVFYRAVQWPGIHTAMLTCFILALPSLGATSHKGLTRVVGCALGSVVALAAAVFIMPHLDTITGLLAITLPVVAIGAWIAAGSPRSNYIGVQFVFAFALSQLGRFGPTTDLTEIRDRMIGILIGVGVSIAISTALWPEREGDALKRLLARLLRSVAELARAGHDAPGTPDASELRTRRDAIDNARLRGWSLLAQNREMQARVALEPGWQYAHDTVTLEITTALAQTQEILFAVNWLHIQVQDAGSYLPQATADALRALREHAAVRLDRIANRFEYPDEPAPHASDVIPALPRSLVDAGAASTGWLADIVQAARVLDERIAQLDRRLSAPVH